MKRYLGPAFFVLLAGCGTASKPTAPVAIRGNVIVNTQQAEADTARAYDLIAEGKLEPAEALLHRAIVADAMYGPAHNNLGLVYFAQGNAYAAAWSFERAAKLMPKRGEPQNNLGLVYENAGRLPEAEVAHAAAVEIEPTNVEFVGNLARVRVRRDEFDDRTRELLKQVVLQDRRPEWTNWARLTLTRQPTTLPDAGR